MNGVATLPKAERATLFRQTSARRDVDPIIIEKDFWVCWTLKQFFELPEISSHLIFKGGTSLSKAFGVIERFSEDIDLSINREYLGFGGDRAPEQAASRKQEQRLIDELIAACRWKITDEVVPKLNAAFAAVLGASGRGDPTWQLVQDATDPQNLFFAYPGGGDLASAQESASYIKPIIKIEMGARSDHYPAGEHDIEPYAAAEFPDYFERPRCRVKVLEAERTFWEKATILHAEYHRPETTATPDRISRHYYDLYRLAENAVDEKALMDLELLVRVVEHKKVFFRSAWSRYDEALAGRLRLLPAEERAAALRRDYDKMSAMFFGDKPTFDRILVDLSTLESKINSAISTR